MTEFSFSETKITSKAFVHTWKINNFKEAHPGIGKYIVAEANVNRKKVWIFNLYPDGYEFNTKDYIGIHLSFLRKSISIENMPYLFIIYIVDKNKMEHQVYKLESLDEHMVIPKFVTKAYVFDEKNELLPNGNLILKFKIYFTCADFVKPKPIQICSCTNNSRTNGFKNIFNKEEFSDVKIIAVGGKVFWAYKGVLATQSPVFAAMFVHDMKENKENSIEITDIDHEVVQEMLRFIYVGKVDNIQKIARNLLAAANKYQIEPLKLMCEETLISELTVETVISLLSLAVNYEAKLLKETAIDFFKLHAKEIVQTEKYKADIDSIAPVLSEIIQSLVL